MPTRISEKRILIVEDNAILAHDLEDIMREHGARTIGPAFDLEAALQLARNNDCDCAILDINLGQDKVWPVARMLHENDTPIVFVSADCVDRPLDAPFHLHDCLDKPVARDDLVSAVAVKLDTNPADVAANDTDHS